MGHPKNHKILINNKKQEKKKRKQNIMKKIKNKKVTMEEIPIELLLTMRKKIKEIIIKIIMKNLNPK